MVNRDAAGPLAAANAAAHDQQLAAYDDFLEALTLLDFETMMRSLDRFRALLRDHMALEEDVIMPLCLEVWPEARAELERIDGDHRILQRSLAAVHDALGELRAAADARRTLVRWLGVFHRPREVLEHHSLRESGQLYPRLDANLDSDRREELAMRLREPPVHRGG